jgi:hypothetical protein
VKRRAVLVPVSVVSASGIRELEPEKSDSSILLQLTLFRDQRMIQRRLPTDTDHWHWH